jgi:hypothetical protein
MQRIRFAALDDIIQHDRCHDALDFAHVAQSNLTTKRYIKLHDKTGDLWFTDAQYGYFQNFRPKPTILNQVYRFTPSTGVVQGCDGWVRAVE